MVVFSDLGESVLLIARFTPHPCAEIMQDCFRGDEWFNWLEKFEFRREYEPFRAIEEAYALSERQAKRARFESMADFRAECEAETALYQVSEPDSDDSW